jgi:hypothetical protein
MNTSGALGLPELKGFTLATFALVLILRLPLAILAPVISPDGTSYLLVADNIFLNACISISPPDTAACIPHWGGNHLPGYPVFVGLVRHLVGVDPYFITVAQSVLVAAAFARLVFAVGRLVPISGIVIAVGLVSALSPINIPWVRFVLPDALVVAAAAVLFAELCLSIVEGRLRVFTVGVALLCACLLRYDAALLSIPVAIIGFSLHSFREAISRGVIVFLIVSIPVGGFLARNVYQGLPLVPRAGIHDGSLPPVGYLAWGNTWITNLTQAGDMGYPIAEFQYQHILIDPLAYDDKEEKQQVEALINKLKSHIGHALPADIDKAFGKLAADKRARHPLKHYLVIPLKRMTVYWLNPTASFGWPLELSGLLTPEQKMLVTNGSIVDRFGVATEYPLIAIGKAVVFLYRILLVAGICLLLLLPLPIPLKRVRILIWAALSYALIRTVVLSYQPSIDNRYMISGMSLIEFALAIWVYSWLTVRKPTIIAGKHANPL